MAGNLGFRINTPTNGRKDIFLFSESQGRIVISVSKQDLEKVEQLLTKHDVPVLRLGQVTDDNLEISGLSFGPVQEWKPVYQNALSEILEQ